MVQINQKLRCTYWATRSSVRSFTRTAHSSACSALLASLAPSAALTHSLAHFVHSLARGKVNDWMFHNDLVLSHSAALASVLLLPSLWPPLLVIRPRLHLLAAAAPVITRREALYPRRRRLRYHGPSSYRETCRDRARPPMTPCMWRRLSWNGIARRKYGVVREEVEVVVLLIEERQKPTEIFIILSPTLTKMRPCACPPRLLLC